MKLSVIMPVVNEARTIGPILERVLAVPLEKEVIVVDDGSTDGTWEALQRYATACTLLRHSSNRGKGAAIGTALQHVTGDIVITQDADLEYDPEDYQKLIDPIVKGNADVVYGSRLLNGRSPTAGLTFYLGGRVLTWLANFLYGLHITDEPTGYKVFRTKLIRSLPLASKGFEFCPEVTALLGLRHIPIVEVPIGYHPRSISEGKKIRWRDGFMAIWTLIRYRFSRSAQATITHQHQPCVRHIRSQARIVNSGSIKYLDMPYWKICTRYSHGNRIGFSTKRGGEMRNITSAMRHFMRDEEGQDIIEYGLLAAFIAIVTALLLVLFKDPITSIYQRILDYLNAANANLPPGPGGG